MREVSLQVSINTHKIALSSRSLMYKTERFMKQSKYITDIDYLVSKLGEAVLCSLEDIVFNEKQVKDDLMCFSVKTADGKYSMLFKFGYQMAGDFNDYDVIFFDFFANKCDDKLTIEEYVKRFHELSGVVRKEKHLIKSQDFNRLYIVSSVSSVNLPKLSVEQKDIVETIDKNVLVQGVAGSGKTNICIDKIIFTACKNYTGKVLYTTFSRGLLNDTKLKVEEYKKDLQEVLSAYKNNNIIFLDGDHKKALQNRLGIYFFAEDDNEIFSKIERVLNYLNSKVDYLLIEDIYKQYFGEADFVDEGYFVNTYCKNLSNYQIEKCFNKLNIYSKEIIYKEIFGMIYGCYDLSKTYNILSLDTYILSKSDSFSRQECEAIYQIALDYGKTLERLKKVDNNIASRKLMDEMTDFEYSLSIIDEVQDYTQVNLCLFKKMSLKMFCVGDALQMINPSYFNFGYLKNLLFDKDVTEVKELKNNYRNTAKIVEIIDSLGEINKAEFGTHSFVLKGQSIDSGLRTSAIYIAGDDFASQVASSKLDNFTFVVSSQKQKADLRKIIKNQEILTVSEVKGLERNTVIAFNLLSDNSDKWKQLEFKKINHKQADENSVFRYYYNLFYVGLSRAKQNIFVVERNSVKQFGDFFKSNFKCVDSRQALRNLTELVSKVEFTQQEVYDRVSEFLKLGQYENARFTAEKILDNKKRIESMRSIEINEELISKGKYREAGIKYWEYGLINEAKKQFILSGDTMLIELINGCVKNNSTNLNVDIIDYFEDVKDNPVARQFILDIVKNDIKNLRKNFGEIKSNFKKGESYGK